MQKLRVAAIGMSQRMMTCYFPVIKKIAELELVAVCDLKSDLVEQGLESYGDRQIKGYTDYRRLLDDKQIDAVFVCVEPENNARIVVDALNAGKHTFCDVPLAYSIEDCWKIVLATERSGKVFQLGEQTRYYPFIRAWRDLINADRLGKILLIEGQYFHDCGKFYYFNDKASGKAISWQEALQRPPETVAKRRFFQLTHPIWYMPHEISPLMHAVDDRIVKVSCMSTGAKNVFDWLPCNDLEMALMQTEKGAVMRLAAGFTPPSTGICMHHWYHIKGTHGFVETNRYKNDKMKMWFADSYMPQPAELVWDYFDASASVNKFHDNTSVTAPWYEPVEMAIDSGHGGLDFYPICAFTRAVILGEKQELDVYRAVETASPAIMAGKSVDTGGELLILPDFRPGPDRKPGESLKEL